MREIILDTETTGLYPDRGDRLVELGCVELVNRIPTGQTLHLHFNPERDMPDEAFRIHGLSGEFLATKPLFSALVDDVLSFVADSTLVIHNASFDMGFINMELRRLGREAIGPERVVDTLAMARRRFPAGPNSLDALCGRFGIDNSRRVKHGALMDAELLAEVYIELIGGRQTSLGLTDARERTDRAVRRHGVLRERPAPLPPRTDAESEAAHAAFIAEMGDKALWLR